MLLVVTGYRYSESHERFYAGGTRTYDGTAVRRTLSMACRCSECGDPIYDGDPICGDRYEAEEWEIVHVNCCTQHADH